VYLQTSNGSVSVILRSQGVSNGNREDFGPIDPFRVTSATTSSIASCDTLGMSMRTTMELLSLAKHYIGARTITASVAAEARSFALVVS
jgi:hypothetical protein